MPNNSLYLIPNEYVPVLLNKRLFKNPEQTSKRINNDILIPLFILDTFEESMSKSPNAFILFRNEVFKKVKIMNPNKSSRELSSIIGNMWNHMSIKNKLPYNLRANEIKNSCGRRQKYKIFLNNIKKREYTKCNELSKNAYLSIIKKLLL